MESLSLSEAVLSHLEKKDVDTGEPKEADLERPGDEKLVPKDMPQYPSGFKLAIVLISVCVAVFLVALVSSFWPDPLRSELI
jgi:hypothetical protein